MKNQEGHKTFFHRRCISGITWRALSVTYVEDLVTRKFARRCSSIQIFLSEALVKQLML